MLVSSRKTKPPLPEQFMAPSTLRGHEIVFVTRDIKSRELEQVKISTSS